MFLERYPATCMDIIVKKTLLQHGQVIIQNGSSVSENVSWLMKQKQSKQTFFEVSQEYLVKEAMVTGFL